MSESNGPPGIEWERIGCPLCGSERQAEVTRTEDYFCGLRGEFSIVECQDCRHLFLNPRPTQQTIGLCYPDDYLPHRAEQSQNSPLRPWYACAPFRWAPGLKWLGRRLLDEGQHVVPPLDKSSVAPRALEVGCAGGEFLVRLAAEGWEVEGIEPGVEASARARSKGFRVQTAGIEEAEIPAADFDAVFAWMVIEHLHDPVGALHRCYDALRPGGQLLFSIPNAGSWERRLFGENWMGYDAPRHLHHFRPAILRRVLREIGFSAIQIRHQPNVRYLYGSLANWGLKGFRQPGWAQTFSRWYRGNPPLWFHVGCTPLAWGLSLLRQSGRITVIATRPSGERQ